MDKKLFQPGIRTKTIHQMGLTFGSLFGLNLGYAMDLFIDTIDLTLVSPTVAVKDQLNKQIDDMRDDTQ
ncbi:hypothetical protein MFMK1_001447 [Metallumcola ferriviriculae]|uniref:Uncharacterized protein n=1 Tax=Metallumcola ferriviriculae TaxID=3039180 RepID=A0AAU0UN82_9FIRM|nr:hypothetical protein MFMK1_001447 [Desulfitibacteraceae bacterium MK1]